MGVFFEYMERRSQWISNSRILEIFELVSFFSIFLRCADLPNSEGLMGMSVWGGGGGGEEDAWEVVKTSYVKLIKKEKLKSEDI